MMLGGVALKFHNINTVYIIRLSLYMYRSELMFVIKCAMLGVIVRHYSTVLVIGYNDDVA